MRETLQTIGTWVIAIALVWTAFSPVPEFMETMRDFAKTQIAAQTTAQAELVSLVRAQTTAQTELVSLVRAQTTAQIDLVETQKAAQIELLAIAKQQLGSVTVRQRGSQDKTGGAGLSLKP